MVHKTNVDILPIWHMNLFHLPLLGISDTQTILKMMGILREFTLIHENMYNVLQLFKHSNQKAHIWELIKYFCCLRGHKPGLKVWILKSQSWTVSDVGREVIVGREVSIKILGKRNLLRNSRINKLQLPT